MNLKKIDDLNKINVDFHKRKEFLESVNKYYDEYNKSWKEYKEDIEKWKNISNYWKTEKPRSPLTIFNGEWGSGKSTFFLKVDKEKDMLLRDSNINLKFKYINLSEHFYEDTNPVLEFGDILSDLLFKNLPQEEQNKIKIKELKKLLLKSAYQLLKNSKRYKLMNFGYKIYKTLKDNPYQYQENKTKKEIEKLAEKIEKPIILVLDNLERLSNCKNIINIIRFYSFLPNFIFILPIDKSSNEFLNYGNSESWIDKYITLSVWFNYEWNYSDLLEKCCFKKKYISEINEVLIYANNNGKFSFSNRALEKIFKNLKYNLVDTFNENKYKGFLLLEKLGFKNSILKDDIKSFLVSLSGHICNSRNFSDKMDDEFKDFINEFKGKDLVKKFDNLWSNRLFIYTNYEKNYKNDFSKFLEELNNIKEELNNLIKKELTSDINIIGEKINVLKRFEEKFLKWQDSIKEFEIRFFSGKKTDDHIYSEIWDLYKEFVSYDKSFKWDFTLAENSIEYQKQIEEYAKEIDKYIRIKFDEEIRELIISN